MPKTRVIFISIIKNHMKEAKRIKKIYCNATFVTYFWQVLMVLGYLSEEHNELR